MNPHSEKILFKSTDLGHLSGMSTDPNAVKNPRPAMRKVVTFKKKSTKQSTSPRSSGKKCPGFFTKNTP